MYCSLSTSGWGTAPDVRAEDPSVQGITVVMSAASTTPAVRKVPFAARLTSMLTFWVVWATGSRTGASHPVRREVEGLPTCALFFSYVW